MRGKWLDWIYGSELYYRFRNDAIMVIWVISGKPDEAIDPDAICRISDEKFMAVKRCGPKMLTYIRSIFPFIEDSASEEQSIALCSVQSGGE